MKDKKEQFLDREFFQEHGRRGGLLGGKKGSANMTAEQRSARAKKAAAARKWHPVLSVAEKAARAEKVAIAERAAIAEKAAKIITERNAANSPGKITITGQD